MRKWTAKASKYRIFVSRILFLILTYFFLFTSYPWPKNSILAISLDTLGFILIVLCCFGRIWSSLFICGYKNKKLITVGPYSITRNPLYFFSFLGAVGIGLVSKNIIILFLLTFFFLFYNYIVVLDEEAKLKEIHQDKYVLYKAKTSRVIPKFSNYKEIEQFTVNARLFKRALGDIMWFFWLYIIIKALESYRNINFLWIICILGIIFK